MNLQSTIKEISNRLGPPKPRAAHGQWLPYAWLVRGLVEKGYGITESVRQVLENSGVKHSKTAFGSLRAAFYKVRDEEWPAELSNEAAKQVDAEQGFE